jgi:hypothetical protein
LPTEPVAGRLQQRSNAGRMKFDVPADVHWMPEDGLTT